MTESTYKQQKMEDFYYNLSKLVAKFDRVLTKSELEKILKLKITDLK